MEFDLAKIPNMPERLESLRLWDRVMETERVVEATDPDLPDDEFLVIEGAHHAAVNAYNALDAPPLYMTGGGEPVFCALCLEHGENVPIFETDEVLEDTHDGSMVLRCLVLGPREAQDGDFDAEGYREWQKSKEAASGQI